MVSSFVHVGHVGRAKPLAIFVFGGYLLWLPVAVQSRAGRRKGEGGRGVGWTVGVFLVGFFFTSHRVFFSFPYHLILSSALLSNVKSKY